MSVEHPSFYTRQNLQKLDRADLEKLALGLFSIAVVDPSNFYIAEERVKAGKAQSIAAEVKAALKFIKKEALDDYTRQLEAN